MAHTEKQNIGTSWHIEDCRVWAEIYYLDSPTDYREYLPRASAGESRIAHDWVLLDRPNSSSSGWIFSCVLIVGLLLLVSGGCFLYLFLDRY